MQRFYDPIEGSIMIDDINMKDLNVNWLRGQIGVVNQVFFYDFRLNFL